MNSQEILQVKIDSIEVAAEGILIFDLRPVVPLTQLPTFTAGSHIDLHLGNGLVRSYSLLNSQDERHRYRFGVNRDPKSRGGSQYLHGSVHCGDMLEISVPRNNFVLNENVSHSVLIAGGIGITPLWSMIQRLDTLGRAWELHYSARTRKNAALIRELSALPTSTLGKVHLNFDQELGGTMLDIHGIVRAAPPGAHFYCCGPIPMLGAFETATASCHPETVHIEYFSAKDAPSTAGGFEVVFAKSKKTLRVPKGKTILDLALAEGVDIQHSCREGVCGSCLVKVLEGVPDHRDLVLTNAEKAANDQMLICCSGSKSERLVLDI